MFLRFSLAALLVTSSVPAFAQQDQKVTKVSNSKEVFEQRIMPIFRSDKPSSCVQCHLSAVDLKDYIRPSSEQTFVSLRDQGMIDLESPENSKILELIRMGEDDFDKGARLIHKKVRQQELDAFSAWIIACCKDKKLVNLPKAKQKDLATPEFPDAVIRHSRKGRLLNSFVRNVWSQRLRCFPCHTPHEIKPNQPKLAERFQKFKKEYGDRMPLFEKTPLMTMNAWVERIEKKGDDELPLLNLEEPQNSLIVLKPTAKLPKRVDGKFEKPSYTKPASHMGGLKMHVDDQSYKSFIAWIKDYSRLKSGEYKTVDQLPADNWFATKRILRMKEAPDEWPAGTTVQFMVHRWKPGQQSWSKQPMAFTQGTITPRKIVNGALFLLAPSDPKQRRKWATNRNKFQPGKYLVKVYVDLEKRIKKDPEIMLGEKELAGSVVIEQAKWQIGFPKAENILGSELKKDN